MWILTIRETHRKIAPATSAPPESSVIAIMETGRSDAENFLATELRLGLPGSESELGRPARGCKRMMAAATEEREGSNPKAETTSDYRDARSPESPPTAKTQVVGWPPIRSYRKNNLQAKKVDTESAGGAGGLYVKVSMDGAPYLRKIDLKVYQSYENLREALEEMFKGFSLGNYSPEETCGCRSNYAVAYEDKDGDWMLAGDVPWRMFISSCKRLRIMRGSDAKGLSSNS